MKILSVIIIMILLPPLLAAGRDSRQSQDPRQDRIVEKVEVTDLLTEKNDLGLTEINFTGDKRI